VREAMNYKLLHSPVLPRWSYGIVEVEFGRSGAVLKPFKGIIDTGIEGLIRAL
jgi:hypothetical protein